VSRTEKEREASRILVPIPLDLMGTTDTILKGVLKMPCYRPLKAYADGKTAKGKTKYLVRGYETNNSGVANYKYRSLIKQDYIKIPCGHCLGCRLEKAKQWAIRCVLESKEYTNNYFLTLTYNNENLPDNYSLKKADWKKFEKDIRRYYEYHYQHYGIRFFACGEYGELLKRPHYHAIMFNLPIYDLEYESKTKENNVLWTSETINKIWGKGYVIIGSVNQASANYTARYILKKQNHGGTDTREPEFIAMSRRPGIAKKYYDEHKDEIFKNDELFITDKDGVAKKVLPPRYYEYLYEKTNEQELKQIKERRYDNAETQMKLILQKTTQTEREYLQTCEDTKKEQIKSLKRKLL